MGFGIFYALLGIPIGYLVDRWSRRSILYLGGTCWSFAAGACGLASSFGHLLLARFAVGVGEAALSPTAYSIIADLFTRQKLAFAVSVFGIGTVVGSAVAFIGGGAAIRYFEVVGPMQVPVLGLLQPWQLVFMLTGLPGLVIAPLIFLVREPVRQRGRTSAAIGTDLSGTDLGGTDLGGIDPAASDDEPLLHFLRRNWAFLSCHTAAQRRSVGFFVPNTSPASRIPSFTLVNARVELADAFGKRISVAGFAKNLLNKDYIAGGTAITLNVGYAGVILGTPRTYGIELSYRF